MREKIDIVEKRGPRRCGAWTGDKGMIGFRSVANIKVLTMAMISHFGVND